MTGIKVEVVHLAWTGGTATCTARSPSILTTGPLSSGRYNYVITWDRPDLSGRVAARDGRLALVQLGPDCTPDPGYSWRLP